MNLVYESVIEYGSPPPKYKCNKFFNISEPAVRVPISSEEVDTYTKLQLNPHQNIRLVHDVFEDAGEFTAAIWNGEGVEDEFCTLEDSLSYLFFDGFGLKHDLRSLKVFLSDVVDGLTHLHLIDLYHGDLNLKSTYYYRRKGYTRSMFILTGLKPVSISDKSMLMLRDLRDTGCLLEDLMMKKHPLQWLREDRFVELKDLIKSLKEGNMLLYTDANGRVDAAERPMLWKQFIFGHIGMMEFEDRPSFILSAVSFIETEKMVSKVKDEDVKLLDKALEFDEDLVPELLSTQALEDDLSLVPDGLKGWYFVKTERNLLSHKPKETDILLRRRIGTTSSQIDNYFLLRSNVVLALYRAVKGTRFKFVSYLSGSHEGFLIEHDRKVTDWRDKYRMQGMHLLSYRP